MKTKVTCPLGHTCEKVVDDHIEVCAWYVGIEGEHPQTGEIINEKRCAMAWQPLIMVDNARQVNGLTGSVDKVAHSFDQVRKIGLMAMRDNIDGQKAIADSEPRTIRG